MPEPSSERTLRRHCRWIDVQEDVWLVDEFGTTKGNRTKFVAYPAQIVAPIRRPPYRYYWKESLPRYPLEFWSEVLAYHIGASMKVKVPPCFPATFTRQNFEGKEKTRVGSLSLSLVEPDKGQELLHGGDLLSIIKPDYERKKGSDHSVQLILEALAELIDDISLYRLLFRQFVFDAIIGNSDRHQDNWGVRGTLQSVDSPYLFEMLPAFDNGTSLGRELSEETIEAYLRDSQRLEAFINRGKAHVRWKEDGKLEQLAHEDLLRKHLQAFKKSRDVFLEILDFDEHLLRRSVGRVCELSRTKDERFSLEISEPREEFIIRVILRRRERLMAL